MDPYVFDADDTLSLAELTAARLDGHVIEFAGAWVAADALDTPWHRAHAIRAGVGTDLAVARLSAAWVYGATDARPARLSLRRAQARRPSMMIRAGVVYHDGRVDDADVHRIAGVLVTTTTRTLVDLTRGGEEELRAIPRLVELAPSALGGAFEWLARHGGETGTRVATSHLRRVAEQLGCAVAPDERFPQDEVTR